MYLSLSNVGLSGFDYDNNKNNLALRNSYMDDGQEITNTADVDLKSHVFIRDLLLQDK